MNTEIVLAVLGLLGPVAGWFAARRKNLADTQTSELDNVEKAVKFYREQFDFITEKLKAQVAETDRMIQLYKDQAEETRKLNIQNKELIEENRALLDELKKYKQLTGKKVSHE